MAAVSIQPVILDDKYPGVTYSSRFSFYILLWPYTTALLFEQERFWTDNPDGVLYIKFHFERQSMNWSTLLHIINDVRGKAYLLCLISILLWEIMVYKMEMHVEVI